MRALVWIALSACASASPPIPNAEVRASQAAISTAEQAGAREDARAAPYLAQARRQLDEADRAMIAGDHELAAIQLRKAIANAELAAALARESRARAEADALERRQP